MKLEVRHLTRNKADVTDFDSLYLRSVFFTVHCKANNHTGSVHSKVYALEKSTARAMSACILRNDTIFIL